MRFSLITLHPGTTPRAIPPSPIRVGRSRVPESFEPVAEATPKRTLAVCGRRGMRRCTGESSHDDWDTTSATIYPSGPEVGLNPRITPPGRPGRREVPFPAVPGAPSGVENHFHRATGGPPTVPNDFQRPKEAPSTVPNDFHRARGAPSTVPTDFERVKGPCSGVSGRKTATNRGDDRGWARQDRASHRGKGLLETSRPVCRGGSTRLKLSS